VSRYHKVKPIWILLKQETVSGSGISWAVCKYAPRSRKITTPTPHHSVFTGRMPFLPFKGPEDGEDREWSKEGKRESTPLHTTNSWIRHCCHYMHWFRPRRVMSCVYCPLKESFRDAFVIVTHCRGRKEIKAHSLATVGGIVRHVRIV